MSREMFFIVVCTVVTIVGAVLLLTSRGPKPYKSSFRFEAGVLAFFFGFIMLTFSLCIYKISIQPVQLEETKVLDGNRLPN